MLEYKDVSAGYHGKAVVQNVNLQVRENEITTLLGPNGCGKSTLLQCVTQPQFLLSGEIRLDSLPIAELHRRERARAVAVFSQQRSVPSMSVESLVHCARFAYRGFFLQPTADCQSHVENAMEITGTLPFRDRNLLELSAGEQQRVFLAMALAQDSELLILDEPANHLDIAHQLELLHLLETLKHEGKTILLVLHNLEHALQIADRIAVMQGGKIVFAGTRRELLAERVIEQVFGVEVTIIKDDEVEHVFFSSR